MRAEKSLQVTEMSDVGLLLVRTTVAYYFMVSHGLPKMRDDDGQHAKTFEGLGFHPGALFVSRVAIAETSAAVLIGLGLFGPLGPMLLLSDMMVAIGAVSARERTFEASKHEIEIVYAAIAVLLTLSGPGRFSADRLLGMTFFDKPWLRCISLGAAAAGAAFMLNQRHDENEPAAEASR
jgi:putative oxidoreductase